MNSKVKYYWLLLIIPAAFIYWFFATQNSNKPARYLPFYGPKYVEKTKDTLFHTIPEFEFIDQDNQKVTSDNFKNSIYVTEYFFTSCQSICPIMNNNLAKVYQTFKNTPGFLILSHTVDPENDSVKVLKDYALRHGVSDKKWLFVTGDKRQLYSLARKGYLLNAEEGNGDSEDFIHTQNFALVDKEKHIRGYYDGTDSMEIDRMIKDIHQLIKEYEYKSVATD